MFVPIYGGQDEMPSSFSKGQMSKFSTSSAWRAFDFVNNWRALRWDMMSEDINAKIVEFEGEHVQTQLAELEDAAVQELKSGQASNQHLRSLYRFTRLHAERVVEGWWDLAFSLIAKYSNGYVTVSEEAGGQTAPGYPKWWLEATNYKGWPGKTWVGLTQPSVMGAVDAGALDASVGSSSSPLATLLPALLLGSLLVAVAVMLKRQHHVSVKPSPAGRSNRYSANSFPEASQHLSARSGLEGCGSYQSQA